MEQNIARSKLKLAVMVRTLILKEKLKIPVQNVLVSKDKSSLRTWQDNFVTTPPTGTLDSPVLELESCWVIEIRPSIFVEATFAFCSTGLK